jgi:glycolate oxidase FAD binding subunit
MTKILKPSSEEEMAEAVTKAANNGTPIRITGGGTRPVGNPVEADCTVHTAGLNGITLYEPGALTIAARAGTPLAEIEAALAKEGQHLPFEPANWAGLMGTSGKSTIGGVVSAGVSGPRRIQAGGARDSLIGVRFVSGEGKLLKNGGRVMKNVTGYDLVKLMAGSHGTLGILTEVTFKILPKPHATGTVSVHGLNDRDAVSVLSAALGSPFDVSGAAHIPGGGNGSPVTLVRVEGLAKSVDYRTGRLKELIAQKLGNGAEIAVEQDSDKATAPWRDVRDVSAFAGRDGALWRISVKPTDGPRIADVIRDAGEAEFLFDWGGGLVWALVPDHGDARAALIRNTAGAMGGHATLMRASGETRARVEAFQPELPRIGQISEMLRRQFDPKNILNPGLMARNLSGKAA